MKSFGFLSVRSAVAALAAALLLGLALGVDAGAGPAIASRNGDVNGDGDIDLSDAVYLLLHLFRGGEPPAVCEDRPELLTRMAELEAALASCQAGFAAADESAAALASRVEQLQAELVQCRARSVLPDTGQTRCFDAGGAEIPCDASACPGQDGAYATGCPPAGRFVDNGDATITDNCTPLMWQQDSADVNGDGRSDGGDRLQWCDALAFCEILSFAGYNDWRLPNIRELQSLVDHGSSRPAIDPAFVAPSEEAEYWSSTSFSAFPGYAWNIDFLIGGACFGDCGKSEGNAYFIRGVRGP